MENLKTSLVSAERREALASRRAELTAQHLKPSAQRPASSARGMHHVAFICSDVETTIEFYQNVLEFPLVEMFENRDLAGSTHFFFDIGQGNLLAFFDLPGVDVGRYAEVLGGLHHIAIAVEPNRWSYLNAKLEAANIACRLLDESSLYFHDPDGARLEIISDPLMKMYGANFNA
jgi:catechol 2,3-dioxygenase-like lactoylglutathione lyase family enzyme